MRTFREKRFPTTKDLLRHYPDSAVMLSSMFCSQAFRPHRLIGKFYLLWQVNSGYAWFAVVAVIFSSISAYFYLRIVMYMYMKEPKAEVVPRHPTLQASPCVTHGAVPL